MDRIDLKIVKKISSFKIFKSFQRLLFQHFLEMRTAINTALLPILIMTLLASCSVANQDIQKSGTSNSLDSESSSSSGSTSTSSSDSPETYKDKVLSWITQLGDTTTAEIDSPDQQKNDLCASVTVDGEGNVYCAGYTMGSLGEDNSGDGSGGSSADAFVMKIDSEGEIQWITQLGANTDFTGSGDNTKTDVCYGITVDDDGNVYCAGYTMGSLGEVNAGDGSGGSSADAFVMKLDSDNGDIQWITQLGATTDFIDSGDNTKTDVCNGIAVDSMGSVYCAGGTEGSLGEANAGGADAFVMKIDSDGGIVWITQLGGTTGPGDKSGNESCNAIAVDNNDMVYCAGSTTGSLGEANAGGDDAFIMQLDSEGSLQWIRQLGASTKAFDSADHTDSDSCYSVAIDSKNNIYCAGATSGIIGFGAQNKAGFDAFILKLNSTGSLLWAKQIGDYYSYENDEDYPDNFESQTSCLGVAIDSKDNVYCAGATSGSLGEWNAWNKNDSDDMMDPFIVALNSDGWPLEIFQLGSTTKAFDGADHSKTDYCYNLTFDSQDNLYCAGFTDGSLGEGNAGDGSGGSSYDVFIMKLASP